MNCGLITLALLLPHQEVERINDVKPKLGERIAKMSPISLWSKTNGVWSEKKGTKQTLKPTKDLVGQFAWEAYSFKIGTKKFALICFTDVDRDYEGSGYSTYTVSWFIFQKLKLGGIESHPQLAKQYIEPIQAYVQFQSEKNNYVSELFDFWVKHAMQSGISVKDLPKIGNELAFSLDVFPVQYSGGNVVRFQPSYWSAKHEEVSKALDLASESNAPERILSSGNYGDSFAFCATFNSHPTEGFNKQYYEVSKESWFNFWGSVNKHLLN